MRSVPVVPPGAAVIRPGARQKRSHELTPGIDRYSLPLLRTVTTERNEACAPPLTPRDARRGGGLSVLVVLGRLRSGPGGTGCPRCSRRTPVPPAPSATAP